MLERLFLRVRLPSSLRSSVLMVANGFLGDLGLDGDALAWTFAFEDLVAEAA